MTVASAEVNGVTVPVEVYCRCSGPKCTVEDGFAEAISSRAATDQSDGR